MKSKQFESQNLVFSPGTWIQKYATTPQIVKKVPSLHGAVATFRLPRRSAAEARGRAGGARRLRRGRAAAAPLRHRGLEGYERLLGPEHRVTLIAVNNLAFVLQRLGKFSEAPLMCCAAVTMAGGWCCILCWEKLGKMQGNNQRIFRSSQNCVIYVEMR